MKEVFAPGSYELAINTLKQNLNPDDSLPNDLSKSLTFELELNHKNGNTVPVEINCSIIRENDGGHSEILVIARAISERKQTEDKIKNAAEEWRTTFDSIPDMVSIHDKDYRIVRVNKAFADAFKMRLGT
jgi:PAS domain-containing protein